MRKIYLLLIAVLLTFSCQKPQYVLPTVERQGITSIEAYFTSGKFVDQVLARLDVADPEIDRFVIPVPWYFPEESEDPTTIHMPRVRVRIKLENNCKIDPPVTILDLNLENEFTFTNPQGVSRKIIITGKRVKSSSGKLMSFNLVEPYALEGFVDNDNKAVYLFSVDDLSGYTAYVTPQTHATVKGGTLVEGTKNTYAIPVANYNNNQTVTVVAHDGVTETKYTIEKRVPTKIPYGFNPGSVKTLFCFEPVSRLGTPNYKQMVYPSLAYLSGYAVLCFGDGSVPIYLDGQTGEKKGTINLGSVVADCITNDEAGNILIATACEGGQTMQLYMTNSVTTAPQAFYSHNNTTDVPMGHHVKVLGDLNSDAVITIAHEGIAGVTQTSKYTVLQVTGGAVVEAQTYDLNDLEMLWGTAPTSTTKVVPVSISAEDGVMFSYYSQNMINYVKATSLVAQSESVVNGNFNVNCMDSKRFNGATYLSHLITGHFPMWSTAPSLKVYDISSPESIADLQYVVTTGDLPIFQSAESGVAAGDVVMGISPDGFKLFIYCYDHNSATLAGFSADCVKIN